MVTTTTSWLAAKRAPSYHGVEPDPVRNAPPWIQTITGRRPPSVAGVHTLSDRQVASSVTMAVDPSIPSSGEALCRARGPKVVAVLTPDHGSGATGGRKRSSPMGGRA